MKPTPELVEQWLTAANYGYTKLAELAAQWGSQQSQDGKRYRWLRDKAYSDLWGSYSGVYPRTGLDASIDAEMEGETK